MPMLMKGEVVVHTKTRTVGQVLETVHRAIDKSPGAEPVLLLKDGTQRAFPFHELERADHFQIREFLRQKQVH